MVAVLTALIWAGAITAICFVAIIFLGRPLRRALEAVTDKHIALEAESAARLEQQLVELEERRHALEISKGTLAEQVAATRASLLRDAAQAEVDATAAGGALDAATDRRRVALQALGEAEAALAPDRARAALEQEFADGGIDMDAISRAYAAYCNNCPGTPWAFRDWIGDIHLENLSRRRTLPSSL